MSSPDPPHAPVEPATEPDRPRVHAHVAHVVEPPHELGPVARFDDAVDRLFDLLRGGEPQDRVFYALTELGDFSLLWHLVAWSRALVDGEERSAIELSAALAVESVVLNGMIKSLFQRERPVVQTPRPHRLRVPRTTSFPSGHASAAVLTAILLSDRHPAGTPAWWTLAALMASSRIYVRIHHASDVVGGAAVGTVLGLGARTVIRRLRAR